MLAKIAGREFNLVKMPRLPKRGNGTVTLSIAGMDVACKVTSNRGWTTDPSTVLEYVWLDVEGDAYYLTLDYAEPASVLKGEAVVVEDGVAKRADPKRVTNKVAVEAGRVEKFKVTYAANRATE